MSQFSRKHYRKVAEIIRGANTRKELVDGLATMFKTDNSRFDRELFETACEMELLTKNLKSLEESKVWEVAASPPYDTCLRATAKA